MFDEELKARLKKIAESRFRSLSFCLNEFVLKGVEVTEERNRNIQRNKELYGDTPPIFIDTLGPEDVDKLLKDSTLPTKEDEDFENSIKESLKI
jgi:hypothetical protein